MTIAGCPWLVPVNLDPEAEREAWVADRMAGLGGSEVAAVVGEHAQKSALDVWAEKTTGATTFQDNVRTRVGRQLEPVLLSWYGTGAPLWERPGGPLVIAKPPTTYHRDRPWQRGSADGLAYYPEQVVSLGPGVDLITSPLRVDHLVEIKTHGWFASRTYNTLDDGIPVEVPNDKRIQCAWYMALYEIDRCHLVALIDTHIQRTYVIHRDREVEAYLLEEAERFWRVHVIGGEPPTPDGSASFGRYLAQRFKTHSADLIGSTPEVDRAARQLIRAKRAQKKLIAITDKLEQVIKRHIGNALGVKTSLGPFTWKSQASGRLREKDARAELYSYAGLTDLEIEAFESRFAQPDHRVMRTPK